MGRGRPQFEITEDVIKKVESLASQGLTLDQIARVLGICYQTLNEKKKEFSDFSDAIASGQAKGVAAISNALFNNAKKGNTTAQMFYLKNRAPIEWRDKHDYEHSGPGGKDLNPPKIVVITGKDSE